jgi:hypothetical protein
MSREDCAYQLHALMSVHFGIDHANAFMDLIERLIGVISPQEQYVSR